MRQFILFNELVEVFDLASLFKLCSSSLWKFLILGVFAPFLFITRSCPQLRLPESISFFLLPGPFLNSSSIVGGDSPAGSFSLQGL